MRFLYIASIITLALVDFSSGNKLIHNYEFLSAEDVHIKHQGHFTRSRRSPSDLYTSQHAHSEELQVDIHVFNKTYNLVLVKQRPAVLNYQNFIVDGQKVDVDVFYSGHASNHPGSHFNGFINPDGNLEGALFVEGETYLIESSDLISNDPGLTEKYPTVAIRESDVDEASYGTCGVTLMEAFKPTFDKPLSRGPRTAPDDNTCSVYAIADRRFSAAYDNDVNKIVTKISYFVQSANNIFTSTDFNGITGLGLALERIDIFKEGDERQDYPFEDIDDPFEKVGSSDYLGTTSTWARSIAPKYCQVYSFTDRDFDGVLGEAYIGKSCTSKYNTGMVSINLSGDKRPQLLVSLTFAHESGHTWGSYHDESTECMPGGLEGNYLMHPQAQDGTREHNDMFSPCSTWSIYRNLVNSGGDDCFKPRGDSFCGNRVVEGDEECDCGFEDTCEDTCCNAMVADGDSTDSCKLISGAKCSPSSDECCMNTCDFKSQSQACGEGDGECVKPRTCPGNGKSCPPAEDNLFSNGTLCADSLKSCFKGNCIGSPCAFLNLDNPDAEYDTCPCSEKDVSDSKTLLCTICCEDKKDSKSECTPINKLNSDIWPEEVYVDKGDLCTNNDGYCDYYHRCRSFVEEGVLLKLMHNLLNKEKMSDFGKHYWWAIALGLVGMIVLIALFVHCAAIYTPTHNPNVKAYQGPKSYYKKRKQGYKDYKETKKQAASGEGDGAAPQKKKLLGPMTQKRRTIKLDNQPVETHT